MDSSANPTTRNNHPETIPLNFNAPPFHQPPKKKNSLLHNPAGKQAALACPVAPKKKGSRRFSNRADASRKRLTARHHARPDTVFSGRPAAPWQRARRVVKRISARKSERAPAFNRGVGARSPKFFPLRAFVPFFFRAGERRHCLFSGVSARPREWPFRPGRRASGPVSAGSLCPGPSLSIGRGQGGAVAARFSVQPRRLWCAAARRAN